MLRNAIILLLLIHGHSAIGQDVKLSAGTLLQFPKFASKFVAPRQVDVWLPEGYSTDKKYSVLYMHDGQMLFDPTSNWNKQEWGVDETMQMLRQQNKISDCIVVAVWNTGTQRHADYFPQQPFQALTKKQQDSIYAATKGEGYALFPVPVQSDAYLKFLVTELKPFIDTGFSVKTDRNNTFMMGSSMGGLISMYAICEYPEVFGSVACLSTHWPGIFTAENNPIPATFIQYLKRRLPNPATHNIYFDYGTATLDSMYKPFQLLVDEVMKQKGYTQHNWISREFQGEEHSENAWRKRLHIPLIFLLGR